MKTLSDVDELLAKRLEWVKGRKQPLDFGFWELRAKPGDIIGRRGWTKREVGEYPGYYHDLEPDEQMKVLREHWFAVWSKEEAERAEKKQIAELKAAQAEKRERDAEFSRCGVGRDWRRFSFDNYKPVTKEQQQALAACENFPWCSPEENAPMAKNFWLLGPYGAGKTHLAIATLYSEFCEAGGDAAFVNPRDMVSEMRECYNDRSKPSLREVARKYGEVDLLVLDDLRHGYAKDKTAYQDDLYEVIDLRARNGLRTIVTSNLMPKDLRIAVGERNYSRLRDGACVLLLAGPDHRQALGPVMQIKTETITD